MTGAPPTDPCHPESCPNFRDVGEWVNCLAGGELIPPGRLFRGGKLLETTAFAAIGQLGTIINLRKGADPEMHQAGADYWHFPISNDYEKYDTADRTVRRWLNEVFRCLANHVCRYPVLLHCTFGRDRTGVAIAVLLTVLGIPREVVIEEYFLSDGKTDRRLIGMTLDGVGVLDSYFSGVDLDAIRRKFLVQNAGASPRV